MSSRFCEHLEEYGSIYTRAEASYLQCNSLVERVLDEGPSPALVELLKSALDEWLSNGLELRTALVGLVGEGRVRIPRKKPPASRRPGLTRCSECRFEIPTLKFDEWKFACNGAVSFQGQEFPMARQTVSK
ncbi:MAG: hypothetical protein KOO60_14505 [Gemmatimonadales bacterium]|nr:hypothetical protein [Gemmatimonadales bacterium]